jgi:hypothetical protein
MRRLPQSVADHPDGRHSLAAAWQFAAPLWTSPHRTVGPLVASAAAASAAILDAVAAVEA